VGQTGISLAIIGVMAAVVQGGLVRVVVPKLGERRAILVGLTISVLGMVGYGLATQGWMIYAILVAASLGGIAGPAAQGLISRGVPLNEQGAVQGALTSLASMAGIVGPPLATGLFGYFIGSRTPVHLPGVPFFLAAVLNLAALLLALRSFRRTPPVPDAPFARSATGEIPSA
jgi:DHA1 family tetracycline resistance protein-like MFS transporter